MTTEREQQLQEMREQINKTEIDVQRTFSDLHAQVSRAGADMSPAQWEAIIDYGNARAKLAELQTTLEAMKVVDQTAAARACATCPLKGKS